MSNPTLPLASPLLLVSRTMKWGLVVSLLLPYVAATLPPYKRFVSPLICRLAWKLSRFA